MDVANIAIAVAWWALKTVAATAMEFLVLVGVFLLFGLFLFWLEKRTFSVLSAAFGFKAVVYTTGWIGTTAHELGHAIMCLVFGHKITEISLFNPDWDSGVMGYVHHSYNPDNMYHQTGRLFIGIAPLFTGGALLVGMVFVFFPDFHLAVIKPSDDYGITDFLQAIGFPVWETMRVIFSAGSLASWQFWVFLYVAICVASHLAPSRTDMEGFWEGLVVVFLALLPVNGIAIVLGWEFVSGIIGIVPYVGVVVGFFAVALLLSLLSFLVSYFVAGLWWLKKYGEILNPISG